MIAASLPRIRKGWLSKAWICSVSGSMTVGAGQTPQAAYRDWERRCDQERSGLGSILREMERQRRQVWLLGPRFGELRQS